MVSGGRQSSGKDGLEVEWVTTRAELMIALIYSDGELKAEDLNLECLEKNGFQLQCTETKLGQQP